jgi:hypothetical protein
MGLCLIYFLACHSSRGIRMIEAAIRAAQPSFDSRMDRLQLTATCKVHFRSSARLCKENKLIVCMQGKHARQYDVAVESL